MNSTVENYAVRGLSPRAASPSTPSWTTPNGLPSDSCAERYVFPTPNIETLKAILRWHGGSDPFVAAVAEGYAPREFQIGMTGFWKVRDAFYRMASLSAYRFKQGATVRVDPAQILSFIVESERDGLAVPQAIAAANSITWAECTCSAGSFGWPTSFPQCELWKELQTATRLCVLFHIWSLDPALLNVDFSSGLTLFSNKDRESILSLIESAIREISILPESTTTNIALTANVQRLLDVLRDGAKSRQELQEKLGVGRKKLLKNFLDPARETGLVVPTEQGSSPNQKYVLTSLVMAANQEQAQSGSGTGLAYPVPADAVFPQKQAEAAEISIFSPVTFPRHVDAPVRLTRYNRWSEAEKALIFVCRVELHLRGMLASGEVHKLGFGGGNSTRDLYFDFDHTLSYDRSWSYNSGILLGKTQCEFYHHRGPVVIGDGNVLSALARMPQLDLAACTETERDELMRMEKIISPKILFLANFYGQRFGVSRDLDEPYHGTKQVCRFAAVEPFNVYRCDSANIIFNGKDRAPLYQIARIDFSDRTLLLPIKYYSSAQNRKQYSMMAEVPDRPALYNSDLIAANPGATVILTDELGIPLVNDSDRNVIFSTWYGGMDFINKFDRDLLEGHPIKWLCFDNGDSPVKMYEKAVTVGTIFQKHGRKIAFLIFDGVTWTRNAFGMDTGTNETSRDVSFDALKVEATKYGVDVGESHESTGSVNDRTDHSMEEVINLEMPDSILHPVLMDGCYCLIYGGSGVAKTWFALYLAIALSQGRSPFDKWEFRGKGPLNVLYVAGEMKLHVYGKRIKELLAEQKSNPHFWLVRETLDLTTLEDQEFIIERVNKRKSKIVVLDNLSTLANSGHTEKQFSIIHTLIDKLNKRGTSVILIHHENREGEFKGSGKIEVVADQSLHLFQTGNGKKIELLVQSEKIRMTSRAEQTSFHTEFDPNNPTAVWPTRKLKSEERRRLNEDDPLGEVEMNVGKKRNDKRLAWQYLNDDERAIAIICDMLSGCHDDVIAANLAVREIAITEFKQQFGITEEALKQCMPRARESAENKLGKKITPEYLAPEIWKLLKDKGNSSNKDGTDRI